MLRRLAPLCAASLLLAGQAQAESFIATTDMVVGGAIRSLEATTNATAQVDDKIVLAAREDAAAFVASEGTVRGAHLEAALTHIRSQSPDIQATDLQLASAILAQ